MEQPRINPHVVLQSMGDKALLMNTETGDCFELNRVGTDVWSNLLQGKPVPDIVDAIAHRYGAERSNVLTDVTALITDLSHHGILLRR
jgi:hypothetical protein